MKSRSNRLVGHEPCPQCRAHGRDKTGDNLAVYADGGAFCFSCHYVRRSNKAPIVVKGEIVEPKPVTYKMKPKVYGPNYHWLAQWLTSDEIDEYFFMDNTWNRHIFLYREGEPDWFMEARSVNPNDQPKSIQKGTKPSFMIGAWKEKRILVVVEDLVSAIKVGRHFGAMPLFGADMTPSAMMRLHKANSVDFVVFWLDSNKFDQAQKLSRRMGLVIPSVALWTEEDPKNVDDSTICELVNEAFQERNMNEQALRASN